MSVVVMVVVPVVVVMVRWRRALNRRGQGWTPQVPMPPDVGVAVDVAAVAVGEGVVHIPNNVRIAGRWQVRECTSGQDGLKTLSGAGLASQP